MTQYKLCFCGIMTKITLDPKAAELLALWFEMRGSAALAPRNFIDPLRLRRWVGDISVIHLHEGPKRYFVSLHGSNVVRHLGPDFHKRYLEDMIPAASLPDTLEPYKLSESTGTPSYSVQRVGLENGLYRTLERMILPCSGDSPTLIDRFLVWVAPTRSKSGILPKEPAPTTTGDTDASDPPAENTTSTVFSLSDASISDQHR